jgi:hypothetical protein
MYTHLPLDDQLNRFFYLDGAASRLVYERALGRCIFRPEGLRLDFGSALRLIVAGELLWNPPDDFQRLCTTTAIEEVQRERSLLRAFLRPPTGHRIDKRLRSRLLDRLTDDCYWLACRALSRGDAEASH